MEDFDYISQDLLTALFEYNSDTGVFIRKITTNNKAVKGSVAGIENSNGYLEIIINGFRYKGVSLDKRSNRYRAYITDKGKQHSLGYYATAVEASTAYNDAAKILHGEFYNENTSIS